MEEAVEAKNSIIKNLRYSMAHANKAYNDAIRVYEYKLFNLEFLVKNLDLSFFRPRLLADLLD